MTNKIYIGIDPGQNTGFAVWSNSASMLILRTLSFFETIDHLNNWKSGIFFPDIKVIIEDCTLNKTTHGRDKLSRNILDRKAQNVGMVKAQTKLLIEFLTKEGFDFTAVKPVSKKLDHLTFCKLTKYKGKTNQHERDAAMLIFGR